MAPNVGKMADRWTRGQSGDANKVFPAASGQNLQIANHDHCTLQFFSLD